MDIATKLWEVFSQADRALNSDAASRREPICYEQDSSVIRHSKSHGLSHHFVESGERRKPSCFIASYRSTPITAFAALAAARRNEDLRIVRRFASSNL